MPLVSNIDNNISLWNLTEDVFFRYFPFPVVGKTILAILGIIFLSKVVQTFLKGSVS